MTASKLAYKAIREMIVSGQLEPGDKVSQLGISKELGISTVPVMEAMRLLESEGVLVKDGRRMAKVRKLSLDEMEGLYLVREGLESIAARLCAQRISQEQLAQLQKLLVGFETAVDSEDTDAFNRLDVEIHKHIAASSNCPLLLEEIARLFLIERTAADARGINDLKKYRSSHRAVIEAIADGDGNSAEYFMKKHIREGYLELVSKEN